MSAPHRVLQVITAFSDEAPAQSATVLAKYLDKSQFDVTAVSLRAQTGPKSLTVRQLEAAGVPHVSMQMGGFHDLRGVLRLARFIRTWRPDVVHTHAFRADFWCGIVGRVSGVRLIVNTVRNHDRHVFQMEHPYLVGKLAVAASRFATAVADAVVAVSAGVGHYLVDEERVPPSKVHVIPNGFDFDRLLECNGERSTVRAALRWQADDIVVGTLAILKPRKGLLDLVHAAGRALVTNPCLRFFIAGEGPERPALEAEIERLGISERFHLLGYRRDPLALLEAADVYVLPSLFEGLSRSLLEAMSLRKPVVVTDISGSRDVVCHEVSGLIVPPGDASRLAAEIVRLAKSPELRRDYGAAGRRAIEEQFDGRRNAQAHELVYRLLLEKRGA